MSDRPITTKLTEAERERIKADGALLFDPEEYDDAIVGVVTQGGKLVLAYEYDRLCEITIALSGSSPLTETAWFEAAEHVDFNMVRGSLYMGAEGPWVLMGVNPEAVQDTEEIEPIYTVNGKSWVRA